MPALETVPRDGLTVHRDCRVAGDISEPSVSVPMARGAKPAVTAMALPDDEPPGLFVIGIWISDGNAHLRLYLLNPGTDAIVNMKRKEIGCNIE